MSYLAGGASPYFDLGIALHGAAGDKEAACYYIAVAFGEVVASAVADGKAACLGAAAAVAAYQVTGYTHTAVACWDAFRGYYPLMQGHSLASLAFHPLTYLVVEGNLTMKINQIQNQNVTIN